MANTVTLNPGSGGSVFVTEDIGSNEIAVSKIHTGAMNTDGGPVTVSNPFPVASVDTGNVASGATDSGNPVKVAGVYRASPITLTDGQRGDLQLTAAGALIVSGGGGGGGGAVTNAGTFAVQVTTSALPTGAALETGGNLATIATNTGHIPAPGQALAGASMPVVLTAAQVTALTPPAAITGFALDASIASLSAKLGSLGQKAMAGSAPVVIASDQGNVPVTVANPTTAVGLNAGTNVIGHVIVDSGSVSTTAPTDATVSANLAALNQAATLTGLGGRSSLLLQLGGTFVGSAVVEYSNDNFTTVKTASYLSPTGVTNAAQTVPGFYRYAGISGYPQARVRCSAWTSGTIAAVLTAGAGDDAATLISVIPQNFQVTDNAVANAAAPTRSEGTTNPLSTDLAGNLRTIGGLAASPTGGYAPNLVNSAATTNATNLKTSAGTVGFVNLVNTSTTAWAYVKFYDKATAPTVGTDTPVAIVALPPGGGNGVAPAAGIKFATGIGYAITGLATNADTTAVLVNQIVGTIGTA